MQQRSARASSGPAASAAMLPDPPPPPAEEHPPCSDCGWYHTRYRFPGRLCEACFQIRQLRRLLADVALRAEERDAVATTLLQIRRLLIAGRPGELEEYADP